MIDKWLMRIIFGTIIVGLLEFSFIVFKIIERLLR